MTLQGQNALITGGGTGTGRSIALALAKSGCKVGITGRRESALAETAALVNDGSVVYQTADVSDREDVASLMEWASKTLGDIHILVNSAGVNVPDRAVPELSPEDFDKMMQINCTGTYNTTWAVLPQMRARQDGVIVNIGSIAGIRSSLLAGVGYSTSKFAMAALGRGVALEEGDNGIRVTNIYPGEINTPILENRPEPVSDERKAKMLQPDDIAACVVLIASLPPTAHIADLVIKPTNQKLQ